jgi:hypothetical protein
MRVERAVWTLDGYLQNLPRKSRIAKRRELRVNLRAASADVGTNEALRRLGNVRTIAAEYVIAEYGGPGPSWTVAMCVMLPMFAFMFWLSNARIDAFRSGLIAANPHLTGMFHMTGITYVMTNDTFTFANGKVTEVGGTLLPLVYVCVVALTVLAGRLWRAIPIGGCAWPKQWMIRDSFEAHERIRESAPDYYSRHLWRAHLVVLRSNSVGFCVQQLLLTFRQCWSAVSLPSE